jgi:deoxyribodipyrimidine photo-lyase
MKSAVKPERVRKLNDLPYIDGPIVYWMSRDQRAYDNWAMIYSLELADRFNAPLAVVFCVTPKFLGATLRQYDFMVGGLRLVESDLDGLGIPFFVRTGDPVMEIAEFIRKAGAGALVSDFSPLKIKQRWTGGISKKLRIPFYEVDAHNIVPCRTASSKQEYAAYTIRPKLSRQLGIFLDRYPSLKKQTTRFPMERSPIDWPGVLKTIDVNRSVGPVDWCRPGYKAGMRRLEEFLRVGLPRYSDKRNDPLVKAQSGLSPYLHFGQISAQRVAVETEAIKKNRESAAAFLEELIVRRELAENFCHQNKHYDSTRCFPEWARDSLDNHLNDKREFVYTRAQLERAATHDQLWNAAQDEMVLTGKMHGYMRMYWAKKILQWSETPEKAFKIAVYLNDKYELDGRDPNGYAGIAWSVGGVHDRPWPERKIFGKVRYMSYDGCRRKFDVEMYIQRIKELKAQAK